MKHLKTLALVAAFVCAAAPAFAVAYIAPQPLMKFFKANSSGVRQDSTEVAVIIHAVGAAPSASQDTTQWLETTGFEFPGAVAASVAFIDFQINHQSIATSDTISYQIQWTNDGDTAAGTASKFASGAMTAVVVPVVGTASSATASIVTGLTSSSVGARWVRVIVWNNKVTNTNVTRKFSVMPIVRLER